MTKRIIETRSASAVLGDNLLQLTAPATDDGGKTWPVGTTLRALSRGYSNVSGCSYQDVTIGSARVRFLGCRRKVVS